MLGDFDIVKEEQSPTKIKVIGVGGGGGNAINRMIEANLSGVDFIVANTDLQVLDINKAKTKIQLGMKLTKGLGAGSKPDIGEKAAVEDTELIQNSLKGADLVFITAGMGGGTGTGASPVIAQIAKEIGSLVVGVVTKPFAFEGNKRMDQAEDGIEKLLNSVDSLITIPNQNIFKIIERRTSVIEAFKYADDILRQGVQGISDIISVGGLINVDFADVKTVMNETGGALMGVGIGRGDNRSIEAVNQAISSPLLEDISITGATSVLLNITGGPDVALAEIDEIAGIIKDEVSEDANVIFGNVIDSKLSDEIRVTVVATGFTKEVKQQAKQEKGELQKTIQFEVFSNADFDKPAYQRYPESLKKVEDGIAPKKVTAKIETPGIEQKDNYDIPAFLRQKVE